MGVVGRAAARASMPGRVRPPPASRRGHWPPSRRDRSRTTSRRWPADSWRPGRSASARRSGRWRSQGGRFGRRSAGTAGRPAAPSAKALPENEGLGNLRAVFAVHLLPPFVFAQHAGHAQRRWPARGRRSAAPRARARTRRGASRPRGRAAAPRRAAIPAGSGWCRGAVAGRRGSLGKMSLADGVQGVQPGAQGRRVGRRRHRQQAGDHRFRGFAPWPWPPMPSSTARRAWPAGQPASCLRAGCWPSQADGVAAASTSRKLSWFSRRRRGPRCGRGRRCRSGRQNRGQARSASEFSGRTGWPMRLA